MVQLKPTFHDDFHKTPKKFAMYFEIFPTFYNKSEEKIIFAKKFGTLVNCPEPLHLP